MIRAVLFDLIGTTVKEADPAFVNTCFVKAFTDNDTIADIQFLQKNRGRDKKTIIEEVLQHQQISLMKTEDIYTSFTANIENNITNFIEMDGAKDVFLYCKNKNIRLCIGTGFSKSIFKKICQHLSWELNMFDYIGISSEMKRSRPYPDMIFDMMEKLKIARPDQILKVGDTIVDIQEGKNANALTAVILSGTQDEKELLMEKPDFVLCSLGEIKEIIK